MSDETEAIDFLAHTIKETFVGEYGNLAEAIDSITRHGGPDGTVDLMGAVDDLADGARRIARAIIPGEAVPCNDAAGVNVGSLTEAVMGVTAALVQIANSIQTLAEVVNSKD